MAPAAGFEPATKWLTATYSTAELRRSKNFEFCNWGFKIISPPKKTTPERKM